MLLVHFFSPSSTLDDRLTPLLRLMLHVPGESRPPPTALLRHIYDTDIKTRTENGGRRVRRSHPMHSKRPTVNPNRERQACPKSSEDCTWRTEGPLPHPLPRAVESLAVVCGRQVPSHGCRHRSVSFPPISFRIHPPDPTARLPVLINLRIPPLLRLRLLRGLLDRGLDLSLDPLPRAQDLALQVEGAALLRVVAVEQALEAVHDLLHVGLAALGRFHVEDLAGLVEGHAAAEAGDAAAAAAVLGLRALVLARGRRLLVGFGEGAADDARADDDDLGDEAVGLGGGWVLAGVTQQEWVEKV